MVESKCELVNKAQDARCNLRISGAMLRKWTVVAACHVLAQRITDTARSAPQG